jgi:hypothetical protein
MRRVPDETRRKRISRFLGSNVAAGGVSDNRLSERFLGRITGSLEVRRLHEARFATAFLA